MIRKNDQMYMQRAMELATNGLGSVAPNPVVGCVIVKDDLIIGEGWHQILGGPHAEVNAVNSVPDQDLIKGATVYVTLEPCSHFGKTPPCSDLLIAKQVGRVVISNTDSNPLVAGRGIRKLRDAGIEVDIGLGAETGLELNKRFFTFHDRRRPYIILKWAQTADGFIARTNFDSKWISNKYSRQLVHKWRSEEAAILVGYNTAKHDNPRLNVRDWSGSNPLRVLFDPQLSLDSSAHLLDQTQSTIVYNLIKTETHDNLSYKQIEPMKPIPQILEDLRSNDIQSLVIEGGSHTLNQFIVQGIWDEARVFESQKTFGEGIPAPIMKGNVESRTTLFDDTLTQYKNSKPDG